MTLWQTYHVARSIDDALRILKKAPGIAKVIAGGTDLILDIQQRRHPPVNTLVDITQIPVMSLIEIQGNEIFVGAAATHKQIANSPIINTHSTALAIASGLIGGPQVRNTGTIGGNVAHALPAADGTIALLALNAQAEIVNLEGTRRVPLIDLFLGPGKSALEQESEILSGFHLKTSKIGESSTFKRIMRPQGVAIAILNLALWLQRSGDEIKDIRISVGPSGPVPRRMYETENYLRCKSFTPRFVEGAYQAILKEASFRTSKHRATKEYREKVLGVLLEESLMEAFNKAGGQALK